MLLSYLENNYWIFFRDSIFPLYSLKLNVYNFTMGIACNKNNYTLWLCQNSYWKWPFLVDLPIKHGDFRYKSPFSYGFPWFFRRFLYVYHFTTSMGYFSMTRGKVSVLGGSSRWVLKTSCFLHVDQVMGINKGWGISWGYNAN